MTLQEANDTFSKTNHFMNHNGMKLTALTRDHAVMELTVREESLNPLGMVHGGALFTLADCAAGVAARSDDRIHLTLSSSFHFFANVGVGETIRAVSDVRRRGRTTSYIEVDILDSKDRLLARGSFQFFCIERE